MIRTLFTRATTANKGRRAAIAGALTVVTEEGVAGHFTYYGAGALSDGTPLKCVPTPPTRNGSRLQHAVLGFPSLYRNNKII